MTSATLKKTVITVVIACAMAVFMAFEAPVRVFAASKPVYASELELIDVAEGEDPKSKVSEGFVLLVNPLYEGKTRTFLTYKPTSNKEEAIVDIKAMHMNGGFSYTLYQDYLKKQELVATTLVADLIYAINEVKSSLAQKTVPESALYALAVLAYFVEDDTGLTLDHLFFDNLQKLGMTEKEWNDHLVTMFMQGNLNVIAAVERLLLIGCSETTSKSFLDTLDKNAKDGVSGVDEEAKQVYSDRLTDYLGSLEDVQNAIKYFEKCQTEFEYTPEMEAEYERQRALAQAARNDGDGRDINVIFKEISSAEAGKSDVASAVYRFYNTYYINLTPLQQTYWQNGHVLSTELVKYMYPGERFETVYDFIMGIDPSTENEADFDEIYPLLAAMTAGQRGMLKVGLVEILLSVLVDKSIYMTQLSELRGDYIEDEDEYNTRLEAGDVLPDPDDFKLSVYDKVDRSLYTPDGIAMTTAALARSQTNGGDPFGQLTEQPHPIKDKISDVLLISLGSVTGLALVATVTLIVTNFTVVAPGLVITAAETLKGFFGLLGAQTFGQASMIALTYLTVALICIMAILIIVRFVSQSQAANYVPTPRVLCSEEELLPTGKLDAEGNEIKDKGYVYYYGVKNPHLAEREAGKDYSGGSGVMDIYNWELEGANREWIALYTTKDTRKGTPIDFSKLKVSENGVETGYATMQNFFADNCDLAEYYRLTKHSDSSIKPKFLHYVVTEAENGSGAGSIFADGKVWVFGGIGFVIGASGGIGLSALAKKSKKEVPEA